MGARNIIAGAGVAAGVLVPAGEAYSQWVSQDAYEGRDMKYAIQQPFYSAAYYLDSVNGRMPLSFGVGLFSEEFMDTDMPWPYMNLTVRGFPKVKGVPFWYEVDIPTGEFASDCVPYWTVGPRFDKLQKEGRFYFLPGIDIRGWQVKDIKAYITAMSKGGYFIDFIPEIGRGTKMDKGRPVISDKFAFDFYLTMGKSIGKDGRNGSIGASTDFENGQFRNASLRYFRNGISGGLSYNFDSDMPGISFSMRTLLDTRSERERNGVTSKREIRKLRREYNQRNHLDGRGH
jgi:hypothetical protein